MYRNVSCSQVRVFHHCSNLIPRPYETTVLLLISYALSSKSDEQFYSYCFKPQINVMLKLNFVITAKNIHKPWIPTCDYKHILTGHKKINSLSDTTSHRSNEPITKALVPAIVGRELGLSSCSCASSVSSGGGGRLEAILVCLELNLKHSKFSKQKLGPKNGCA
jgi:hypothetical protein